MEKTLQEKHFKNAEYERTVWQAVIEPGISFDEVMKPQFWAHIAAKLVPNARIEVLSETGEYFAELLVMSCDRTWAKVALLRFVELSAPAGNVEIEAAGYKIEWKGPTRKHVVIRLADNEIIKDELPRKADAELWVREHAKAMAA